MARIASTTNSTAKSKGTDVGKNTNFSISGNKLTIVVDLTKDYGLSGGGKTNIVASCGKNVNLATLPNGEKFVGIVAGINVFKYLPKG